MQESSGLCRAGEDERGERGQACCPGHVKDQVSRLFSELGVHRDRQVCSLGRMMWEQGVSTGVWCSATVPILSVGLSPAW